MPDYSTDQKAITVGSNHTMSIRAGYLEREWRHSQTGLRTVSLRINGVNLDRVNNEQDPPECSFDGLLDVPRRRSGRFPPIHLLERHCTVSEQGCLDGVRDSAAWTWNEPSQNVTLVRRFFVYPGTSAYVTDASVQSESVPQTLDEFRRVFENVIETVPLDIDGWRATCLSFYGRTDYHNRYVDSKHVTLSREGKTELSGNLLFLEHPTEDAGLFILHESPPEGERRPEVDCTFRLSAHGVEVMGWGVVHSDVVPERARKSYAVAVGAFSGGLTGGRKALLRFLKVRFPARENDLTVVANPWGDGRCYAKFCEPFLLEEISAAGEIGVTHYQIDDGWQSGKELARLTNDNWARPETFWDIDSDKFPEGFRNLQIRAVETGVKLALWFAPDVARGYRNWRKERDILVRMCGEYGIELVKLDGIRLYTKEAEENLIALMEGVMEATEGRVRFNLDVTNGLRLGFFANLRYGNLFLENRYVTGSPSEERTYRPWRVLKNLWHLAQYLPAERLQFEFANLKEAALNEQISWDTSSPLTPFNCSWEYVAAITLMASPLCWLEPSNVPSEARGQIRRVMDLHRKILPEISRGLVFPIGEEPDGSSWTGFECFHENEPGKGLLLVFRENTAAGSALFQLYGIPEGTEQTIAVTCISHETQPSECQIADNKATVTLPETMSFRLFSYSLQTQ